MQPAAGAQVGTRVRVRVFTREWEPLGHTRVPRRRSLVGSPRPAPRCRERYAVPLHLLPGASPFLQERGLNGVVHSKLNTGLWNALSNIGWEPME